MGHFNIIFESIYSFPWSGALYQLPWPLVEFKLCKIFTTEILSTYLLFHWQHLYWIILSDDIPHWTSCFYFTWPYLNKNDFNYGRYVYIGNIFSKPKGCWFRHGLVGDMLGSFFFSLHTFVSDFVQFEPSIFCILKDLKDYMRQAGEVTYADAHKEHKNEGWGYILLFNEVFSWLLSAVIKEYLKIFKMIN